jgi:hypothetical protein
METGRKVEGQNNTFGEPRPLTYSPRPSLEEIARRQRVYAETLRLRARIGQLDLTMAELLAEGDEVDE